MRPTTACGLLAMKFVRSFFASCRRFSGLKSSAVIELEMSRTMSNAGGVRLLAWMDVCDPMPAMTGSTLRTARNLRISATLGQKDRLSKEIGIQGKAENTREGALRPARVQLSAKTTTGSTARPHTHGCEKCMELITASASATRQKKSGHEFHEFFREIRGESVTNTKNLEIRNR